VETTSIVANFASNFIDAAFSNIRATSQSKEI